MSLETLALQVGRQSLKHHNYYGDKGRKGTEKEGKELKGYNLNRGWIAFGNKYNNSPASAIFLLPATHPHSRSPCSSPTARSATSNTTPIPTTPCSSVPHSTRSASHASTTSRGGKSLFTVPSANEGRRRRGLLGLGLRFLLEGSIGHSGRSI